MNINEQLEMVKKDIINMDKKKFESEVLDLISEKSDLSFIDAACIVCENNGIDTRDVKTLISPILKEKIQIEASDRKLLSEKPRTKKLI